MLEHFDPLGCFDLVFERAPKGLDGRSHRSGLVRRRPDDDALQLKMQRDGAAAPLALDRLKLCRKHIGAHVDRRLHGTALRLRKSDRVERLHLRKREACTLNETRL
jgi:hypothetical protein